MGEITLVGAGHLLIAAGLSLHILLRKERPVSAVLWLAVVWAFPYLGALAYLSFGVDRVARGAAAREATQALVARRARERPLLEWLRMDESHLPGDHPAAHIFRATDPAVRPHAVLRGNRAELLVDGDAFYPALFEAVDGAERSIHVQTYIFARDRVGRALRDRLAARARDGLEVRLLYDRFGSTFAHFSGFFAPLRQAGAEARSISQANPLKGRLQINLRNHRKLVVVDGRVGFVGGMNIAERNVSRPAETGMRGASAPTGPSMPTAPAMPGVAAATITDRTTPEPVRPADRDYQVRLEGPAVADLQLKFLEDWCFATGAAPSGLLGPGCFPPLDPVGEALVQVVPGAPETGGRGLAESVFAAIVAAERSVTIVTPYFIPDEPILQALRYAAFRGVRVRLVLPARSNHWYTGYAARALYEPLLQAGVRIFERGPPFMHAKALVVDGVYALLGSANLDHRSLYLNFELNLEVAEPAFLARVERQVAREVAASREITLDAHRTRALPRRLLENFCRLFQPVL